MEKRYLYNLEVYEDGTILNSKTGKKLGLGSPHSYKTITLYTEGKRLKNTLAHRLIYEAFHGPIPPKMWINHKDGNKSNNAIDNLELTTPSENHRQAYRVLKRKRVRGLEVSTAVLSPEANEAIHLLNSQGWSQRKIAATFNVSQCLISKKLKERLT